MTYPTIHVGGEARIFALEPRSKPIGDRTCCSGVLGVGDAPAIDPRDVWEKAGVDFSDEVAEILDQDGLSLCHSWAGTILNEICNRLQGEITVLLSAGNLAGQVTDYRDDGAAIQDVMPVLLEKGQAPRSLIAQNDYRGRDWPDNWKVEAAKFRLRRCWECGWKVFDSIVTSLRRRWPVLLGTSAFGGGHAVVATAFYYESNQWWLAGPNSWGLSYKGWDRPGFWTYPERSLRDVEQYGAFAAESSVANPDDPVPGV